MLGLDGQLGTIFDILCLFHSNISVYLYIYIYIRRCTKFHISGFIIENNLLSYGGSSFL